MNKLLVLGLLAIILIAPSIFATDLSVIYVDTLDGADTNTVRCDTAYTGIIDLSEYGRAWISVAIEGIGYPLDTSFANDTFFVFLQYSPNRINWTKSDTLQKILKGANDTIINLTTPILNRDSLNVGNFFRVMFCHRNVASDCVAAEGNSYSKKLTAWFNTVK